MTISVLGWVATAVFATSYLSRQAPTLRRIQACAACLWIIYGLTIGAVLEGEGTEFNRFTLPYRGETRVIIQTPMGSRWKAEP